MRKLLCKIGFFLLKIGGWNKDIIDMLVTMPPVEMELLEYTKLVVGQIEKSSEHGTSGEWKRHVAFAVIRKKFPTMKSRQISIAIEIAL